jgi:diguanylate cyclase (GGDEF)-like protein
MPLIAMSLQTQTISIHSDDAGLAGWLAGVAGETTELRVVTPGTPAALALVDDGLVDAEAAVRRLSAAGATCLALTDGGDVDRLLSVMNAGAHGSVTRDGDAAVMRGRLVAASQGTSQLPTAALGLLIARLAGDDAPPPMARSVLQEVIRDRRFEIVLQPIADLRSGEIMALETLARFTAEPTQPPNVWLAQAEFAGLRIALEHELLRAAIKLMADVPRRLAVFVNLSPSAAVDPGLAGVLEGVPLDRLVLEITDHRQLDDYEPLSEALGPLRAAGLRLAVDDSGQGLRSLQQVAQLGPSFMKLNRTLTRDVDHDPTKLALAYALAAFATQVGASVVAEGLETDGELQALRGLGATMGQGYLLGRPRPLGDLELDAPLALPGGEAGTTVPAGPQLELRGAARDDFREAVRGALRFLANQVPGATFVIAHLDYVRRRHTLIGAHGPLAARLEPGSSTAIEHTMCFHMAAGHGARICPDVHDDVLYGPLPLARALDAGSYMGVPLELPGGARFGSLFAVAPAPDAFAAHDVAAIDAVGKVLSAILVTQTAGMDRGALLRFLRQLARTDGLTGALNAPGLHEVVKGELRRRAALRMGSYVSVELDDFPSLREQYGRAVGDLVLKDVAAALDVSTQDGDVVGRVGEDRFGVLLVCNSHEAGVQRLLHSLEPRLAEAAGRRELELRVRTGSVSLADVVDAARVWEQATAETQLLGQPAAMAAEDTDAASVQVDPQLREVALGGSPHTPAAAPA